MLVLTRKKDESIRAILTEDTLEQLLQEVRATGKPAELTTTIIKIKGHTTRVGVEAPKCVRVIRGEIELDEEKTVESVRNPASNGGTE